ncbi:MAG: class I SAM-dependent methyltransferase, partial [Nitrososphaerales archaeon]
MNHSLDDLEALARQFDTDKQAGQNGYLTLYLEYIERQGIKRDAPLKILEIGTNKGSSLRMWTEYFPNAQVYGLDITRE